MPLILSCPPHSAWIAISKLKPVDLAIRHELECGIRSRSTVICPKLQDNGGIGDARSGSYYARLETIYFTTSAAIDGISSSGSITSHCFQPSGTVSKMVFKKGT